MLHATDGYARATRSVCNLCHSFARVARVAEPLALAVMASQHQLYFAFDSSISEVKCNGLVDAGHMSVKRNLFVLDSAQLTWYFWCEGV